MKQNAKYNLKRRLGLCGIFSIYLIPTLALTTIDDFGNKNSVKRVSPKESELVKLIEIKDGNNAPSVEEPRLRFSDFGRLSFAGNIKKQTGITLVSESDSEADESPTYAPLYLNDFESQDKWDAMTVVNANNDSETWEWYSKHDVRCNNMDNPDHEMDDWLITPLFKLAAGKKYKITYKVRNGMSKWPERYGVYIGTDTIVDAMKTVIMEPELVTGVGWQEVSHDYAPDKTGEYALGFYGCSDKDTYNLHFDDIAIAEYIAGAAPSTVTELAITPDPNYETNATITCNAPVNDLKGQPLKENVDIVLMRDSIVLDTLRNIAPGATCSYIDKPRKPGVIKYSASVRNAQGESPFVFREAFVGVNLPASVSYLSFEEIGNSGKVTATWTPVTMDVNGNVIPESKISYSIYDLASNSRTLIAENIKGTSYTFQFVKEGLQYSKRLGIWAVTDYGESQEGMSTDLAFVGTPYDGYAESFANAGLSHDIIVENLNGKGSAGLGNDGRFADYKSADNDNGFIYMAFSAYDDACGLSFGKVSLKSIEKPTLTFYTYNVLNGGSRDLNLIEVKVREVGTKTYSTVAQGTIDNLCQGLEGWGRITVDLSAYADKNIEFQIIGTARSVTLIFLDDIRIDQLRNRDLKAHNIEVPSKVAPGARYSVDVTVANDGHDKASGYDVNLFCDGTRVATLKGDDIEPARSAVISFPLTLSMLSENKLTYYAEINFNGDEKTGNNRTKSVILQPLVSRLPKATALTAEPTQQGVVLNWTEPVYQDGVPETVTEDFETAPAWEKSFEDWTFVDVDDSPVGGIAGVPFPGVSLNQSCIAYFVVDNTNLPSYFVDRFIAHSGTQYLGALLRYDAKDSDDWAISPTLSGNRQTISFWAKSVLPNYNECVDVLWSSGSLNPDDFFPLVKDRQIEAKWTQISVEIPQGAKYFAIRSHSEGGMLLIDDVTFERVYNRNLTLLGYNVWRDLEKVNAEPVAGCEYVDKAPGGTHSYRVTAVYDKGESRGSDSAEISVAGINEIMKESAVKISTGKGYVNISGVNEREVDIYNISGISVYRGVKSGTYTVNLEPGVYILKVGTEIFKIIIN